MTEKEKQKYQLYYSDRSAVKIFLGTNLNMLSISVQIQEVDKLINVADTYKFKAAWLSVRSALVKTYKRMQELEKL